MSVKYGQMNPQVKAQWVTALRSNKYKQGLGVLSNGNVYCCLGVLCALHKGFILDNYKNYVPADEKLRNHETTINGASLGIPDSAVKFLACANDGKRLDERGNKKSWGFKKIANWIEKNL